MAAFSTAAAVIGSAALGAVGANSQASAAKKAANAQVAAADRATDLQRETYYDQRALLAPSITAGASARARQKLMQGYSKDEVRAYLQSTQAAVNNGGGSNGGAPDWTAYVNGQPDLAAAYNTDPGGAAAGRSLDQFGQWHYQNYGQNEGRNLPTQQTENPNGSGQFDWVDSYDWQTSSPSYDFRFNEGQRALERSKAASGDYFSGDTAMALQNYGQNAASQEFEADWRRLGELAGDGTQATGTTVNVAGQFGQSAANNTMAAGNARATGYQQAGNAWGNFWQGAAGIPMYGLGQGWWGGSKK